MDNDPTAQFRADMDHLRELTRQNAVAVATLIEAMRSTHERLAAMENNGADIAALAATLKAHELRLQAVEAHPKMIQQWIGTAFAGLLVIGAIITILLPHLH